MEMLRASVKTAISLFLLAGACCWIGSRRISTDELGELLPGSGGAEASPRASVLDLDWTPDGTTLLSRSCGDLAFGSSLLLHSLDRDAAPWPVLPVFPEVCAAVCAPDGSAVIFALVGDEHAVWRFDRASDEQRPLFGVPPGDFVRGLAISPDNRLAAVAIGPMAILCDARDGRELTRLAGDSAISHIAFSPDSQRLGIACQDGALGLWDTDSGLRRRSLRVSRDNGGNFMRIAFSNDGRQLASAGMDGVLRFWDTATGDLQWEASLGQGSLLAVAISPDGQTAVTGGFDKEIVLWNLSLRKPTRRWIAHTRPISALRFSPTGETLASAGGDGMIHFWYLASGTLLRTIPVAR